MARVKHKKKPLRGSIRQNTMQESGGWFDWFGFWPRLALLVLGCIALIFFVGWLWRGQWPRAQQARIKEISLHATQSMGFAVKDVIVEGRNYTEKKALLDALNVKMDTPIFAFDPQMSYAKIAQLPWTKSVSILRSLPNKIIVRLVERTPVARLQHNDKTIVIDEEGKELTAATVEQFPHLPLVVGDVTPSQTEELLVLLSSFPMVSQRLKAAVRVAGRRWNLYLHPNLLIRLPETDAHSAMIRLEDLIKNQKIAERGVKAIDLRLPEKVFIEPEGQDDDKEKEEKKK